MKPYGYVRADGSGIFIYGTDKFEPPQDVELVPVYLAREWVGLTDEQREACTQSPITADNYQDIEAKLRELNT